MIEEALPGTTPQVQNPTEIQAKGLVKTELQSATKQSTTSASNTLGRSKGKNERLIFHVLIGSAMTILAVAGYIFLGPHTDVNAAEPAGNQIVNVATDVPVHTTDMSNMDGANHMQNLVVMQAEMDAIIQQMNTLQHGSMTLNTASSNTTSPVANSPLISGSGSGLDQAASTLDQMMLITHNMVTKINSLNQQSGAAAPVNGSGHGHH